MESIVIEFAANTEALLPAIDLLEKMGSITAADAIAYKKLSDESVKAAQKIIDSGKNEIKTLNSIKVGVDTMTKAFAEGFQEGVIDELQKAGVSTEQFVDALDGIDKKTGSLKSQLRSMKEELSALEEAGMENSDQFRKMAIEAAKLEDQIGDTNARIKAMSSDTFAFDAAISGIQGVAAGFQVAQGAIAAFGIENEDVNKALVKLNAIMAITQGLQQIRVTLEKQSAIMIAVTNAQQKIAILQTQLQGATESKNIVIRYAAAAAQRVLNLVMMANPAGILLVAIGALAGALVYFSSTSQDAAKAQEKLNDEFDRAISASDEYQKNLDKNTQLRLAELKNRNASEQELRDEALRGLKRQLDDQMTLENNMTVAFVNASDKRRLMSQKKIKLDADELESIDKTIAKYEAAQKKRFDLEDQVRITTINNATATNKELTDKQKEALEHEKDAAEKSKSLREKSSQEAQEIAKKNAQALFEIEQRRIQREAELFNGISSDENNVYEIRLLALQQYEEKQKSLIELQKNYELSNTKLTNTERINIIDKYKVEEEKLTSTTYKTRNDLIKKYDEELKTQSATFITELTQAEERKAQTIVDNVNEIYKKLNRSNATEQDIDLSGVEAEFNKGLMSVEDYEKKRQAIKDRYARQDINNEIARLEAIIGNLKSSGADTEAFEEQLLGKRDELRATDLANHTKNEKDKTAITAAEEAERQRRAQEAIELINAGFALLQQGADTFFAGAAARRQADLDNGLKTLADAKAKEADNHNLTEQQKADIDKKYAAKQADLKRKAYQDDKEAKIQQAKINGLLAITNIFATMPWVTFGVAQAIAITATIASTAAQVAQIRAAPIPQFKKGTKNAPKGYALVGEEGPEIIYLKGGEKIYNYTQSTKILNHWEKGDTSSADHIINNNTSPVFNLRDYVASYMPTPVSEELLSSTTINNNHLDYDKLAKAVVKHLPPPVQNNISFDKDGLKHYVVKAGNETAYQNSRYSVNQ